MDDLSVVRWRKYGKDRLYVNGADERQVGWCDLLTGAITVEDEANRGPVQVAVQTWNDGSAGTVPEPARSAVSTSLAVAEPQVDPSLRDGPEPSAPAQVVTESGSDIDIDVPRACWEDLAGRHAGQSAREEAVALKQAAPVRTFFARVLGVHTDERAWRIGADGEEMVAAQLAKLMKKDPRWRVLHAVPVGENGSDIDHVVIGPPGVFTLNAKHHPGAKIWVAGNTFMVNGQRQPYLRNSRHEAQRAAKLLTAAAGVSLHAVGVVVPVGAQEVVIKTAPEGVHVVYRKALVKWLERQPELLDMAAVDHIYEAARRSTTWQPSSRLGR